VATSEIIFAIPPSLPQGRHLRLHRRVLHVRFQMEGYELSGRIYLRPGAEVGEYLLRSSRIFVPITDAELVHQRDPQFRRLLPVVIMNARHVSRIHLVDGQPGAAAVVAEPQPAQPVPAAEPPAATEPPPAATPPAFSFNDIEPLAGSVHRALSELAALHRDGLINEAEFEAKRVEILSRL